MPAVPPPPSRRVTIRDVAAHAGVSRQTVSNALNAPDRLSAPTLDLVRRAIDDLGYHPDQAARALSSRRSGLIGIRVGATAHRTASHPDRLLHELVHAAQPHGYRFLAFDAPYGDDDAEIATYAELVAGRTVDAVVVADTHPGDLRPAWLAEHDVPFVAHGRPWGDPDARHPWVDVDGAAGTALAVDHLVARGHRRIAFLGWPADGAGGDERRDGWRAALLRHGLDPAADLVAPADDPGAGAAVLAPLLAAGGSPTAVVCASDTLAVGALAAVTDAGATPGRDVAVTGFDDSDLARLTRPGLASLRQPVRLVAQTLVDQVLDRLGVLDEDPRPAGLLAPELVLRPSAPPSRSAPSGRSARSGQSGPSGTARRTEHPQTVPPTAPAR